MALIEDIRCKSQDEYATQSGEGHRQQGNVHTIVLADDEGARRRRWQDLMRKNAPSPHSTAGTFDRIVTGMHHDANIVPWL
jgi:hypothetical protein